MAGYPVAVAVITRWVPVVRERRWPWLLAHQAATAAIVAGWVLLGRRAAAAVNGAWFVVAAVWYARGPGARTAGAQGWGDKPSNDKESPDDRHG